MIVRVSTELGIIPWEFDGERLLRLWLPTGREVPGGGVSINGEASGRDLPQWVILLSRDLQAYARGQAVDLNQWAGRVDLTGQPPFRRRVYQALLRVPRGETRTYGQLAAEAGSPGAARAVGNAMACNRYPLIVPCHRVVGAAGSLGGYSAPGGLSTKRLLLAVEQVT